MGFIGLFILVLIVISLIKFSAAEHQASKVTAQIDFEDRFRPLAESINSHCFGDGHWITRESHNQLRVSKLGHPAEAMITFYTSYLLVKVTFSDRRGTTKIQTSIDRPLGRTEEDFYDIGQRISFAFLTKLQQEREPVYQ